MGVAVPGTSRLKAKGGQGIGMSYFTKPYREEPALLLRNLMFFAGVMSVLVNTLVLVLVVRMRREWGRVGCQLVGLVTVLDLATGVLIVVGYFLKRWLGYPGTFEKRWFCDAFGMAGQLFTSLSGYVMAMLAFERFSLVCRGKTLQPRLVYATVAAIALANVVPGVATSLTGGFAPDPLHAYCVPHGTPWASVFSTMLVLSLILPFVCVLFSYLAISMRVFERYLSRDLRCEVQTKVVLKSFLTIALYSLCFLPKFTTIVWYSYFDSTPPDALDLLAPIGINLLMCVNPLLILFLHNQFRREAAELFRFKHHSQAPILQP